MQNTQTIPYYGIKGDSSHDYIQIVIGKKLHTYSVDYYNIAYGRSDTITMKNEFNFVLCVHPHLYNGYKVSPYVLGSDSFADVYEMHGSVNEINLIKEMIFPHWRNVYHLDDKEVQFKQKTYHYTTMLRDYRKALVNFVTNAVFHDVRSKSVSLHAQLHMLDTAWMFPYKRIKTQVIKRLIAWDHINRKASFIQKVWRMVIADPQYLICRNRLMKEFQDMA